MNEDDLNTLMFCSFRYALGRMTYIVADICRILSESKNILDAPTKALIIKEILKAEDEEKLGMDMDKEEWIRLVEVLKNE